MKCKFCGNEVSGDVCSICGTKVNQCNEEKITKIDPMRQSIQNPEMDSLNRNESNFNKSQGIGYYGPVYTKMSKNINSEPIMRVRFDNTQDQMKDFCNLIYLFLVLIMLGIFIFTGIFMKNKEAVPKYESVDSASPAEENLPIDQQYFNPGGTFQYNNVTIYYMDCDLDYQGDSNYVILPKDYRYIKFDLSVTNKEADSFLLSREDFTGVADDSEAYFVGLLDESSALLPSGSSKIISIFLQVPEDAQNVELIYDKNPSNVARFKAMN